MAKNAFLSADHAETDDIAREWDQGNEQWWDWYMSLADNPDAAGGRLTLPEPAELEPLSAEGLTAELAEPYPLTGGQIASFRRDSFVKLKGALSPRALSMLRSAMKRMFAAGGERLGSRFGSMEMMWQADALIREFVFSRRLAGIAGDLLGVKAIRLYHDNGLSKQPGCGRTPWHYDDHHFPIASHGVCTAWAPLQAIPQEMGPLGFAKGMELHKLIEGVEFNKFDTSYDRRLMAAFREHRIEIDESPFELGEVSFHHNFNFHTAGGNRTNVPRMVLATTYFEDGARVIDAPHMVNGDWRKFMPGVGAGEVIDTPLNPVLWRAGA